jgi:Protein of unknown function (DUF3467)
MSEPREVRPGGLSIGGPIIRSITPSLSVYSNQLRVGVTPGDVTIVFSTMEDHGSNQLLPEDKVSIHLSPMTAKLLLKNLEMIMNTYESVIGNIPTPPKAISQMETQATVLRENLTNNMSP